MKIEHIAMYVNDLETTKDFFIKYFDAKSNNGYHNKTTNFKSYFLTKSARIPPLQGRHRMHIGENDLEVYE